MILNNGILTSTLFEGLPVNHGFTTRACGNLGFGKNAGDPDVIENRRRLFEAQDLAGRIHVQPKQVHSERIIAAEHFQPGVEADAIVASDARSLLSVLTADCVPVLVYHPSGRVAAIHAGWRGLYDEIVPKTLSRLPSGVLAAVGPAIGLCCYEVGEDLAGQFERKFGKDVVAREPGRKPHLDLVAVAALQLQQAGVQEMELSHLCTACHPELFFSFRRDGSSGRQMSFIGLVSFTEKDT